jgi:hypothetical protein
MSSSDSDGTSAALERLVAQDEEAPALAALDLSALGARPFWTGRSLTFNPEPFSS